MGGCCPADAARELGGADSPARDAEFDASARPIREGAALIQLVAPTMHCGGCVVGLERGVGKLDGVLSVRANLTARRVAVEFDTERLRGADIAHAVERQGYPCHPLADADAAAAAEAAETRDLLVRLGVAGFAAANVMLLSVSVWSGAEAATRDLMHWLSALIAAPAAIYAGRPFFASALAGLRVGRMGMDLPISLAILLALAISFSETLRGGAEAFFDAAITLTFLLLIGRYLDRLMRARARSAAGALARMQPSGAIVVGDGHEGWRPLSEISPGDLIRVAPGERAAADGEVVEGASDVDASWITGEAAPEAARPGVSLRAGAMNLTGPLLLRVAKIGADSSLAEAQALMEEAESRKSGIARLADRAAAIYAPLAHLIALAAFLGHLWLGADWRDAAFIAIAALIITCPCALGLAAPMAQAAAAGALFRRGIMLKDGAALERLATIRRAVFDKTGTLTAGRPLLRPGAPEAALAAAAALGAGSAHPLARALAEAGGGRPRPAATGLREVPGYGIEGVIDGAPARLGRADWVGAAEPEDGATATWLKLGEAEPVAFLFDDALREGAEETVGELQARGLGVEILSGDRPAPVAALARRLGVADWTARATPAGKIAHLRGLSEQGALMVGDGVNDAPALAEARVSMAPASAADLGRAAADLVFLHGDLRAVTQAHETAIRTRRIILQNFALAALYNAIAVPIAATGHASPLIAALAMSSSSIIVVANALRLSDIGRRSVPDRAAMRMQEHPA